MTGFEIFMVVTAIASALAGGYSAVASGNAQAAAAQAAAEQEAENAKLAQQQANQAVDQGEAQKNAIRLKMAEMRAQGRTGYAAGNVALGAGTPVDYESDLDYRSRIDLDTIDTNTNLAAWGYKVQATNSMNSAAASAAQAANAQSAGYWAGASSLLSGASKVASHYVPKTSGNWTQASMTDSSILGNSGFRN